MSTRTSPPQVAFSSGEIDPLLHRRFDYQRYQTGLHTCRGFLPLPQGGVTRAPGTIMGGETRDGQSGTLVPFVFSEDDACVLEFTHQKMRVWRNGSLVLNSAGTAPYELTTPFGSFGPYILSYVQSADVLYIASGVLPIQRLARFALDNWTIGDLDISGGPFLVQNLDKARTVRASAETGTITLTANVALFEASDIGVLWRIEPTDYTTVGLWTSNEDLTVGALRRYGDNIYELLTGTNAGLNPPIHREGDVKTDNSTSWRYQSDKVGLVRITGVTSPTVATAVVVRRLSKAVVDDPTYRWSQGAWSALRGYPTRLALFDQRMVAAATETEPRTIWFSVIGAFDDFTPGVLADEGFAYTLAGRDTMNAIVGLTVGRGGLHILAQGEEYSSRSDSRNQAIGPTTAFFGLDGNVGASGARPIAPNGDPVFISRDRGRVMAIRYNFQADANEVVALSRASAHLGKGGFSQIVWQSAPEPMAWVRKSNGELAVMVYDATEDVLGWAQVPLAGGICQSICVTPHSSGRYDVVTILVRRNLANGPRHYVEVFAPNEGNVSSGSSGGGLPDFCHFYGAEKFTVGLPVTERTIARFAGQVVHGWTDQGEFGPVTATPAGKIELPFAASFGYIGLLDTTQKLRTLDIQAAAQDGNTMGRAKRITKAAIGLHNTSLAKARVIESWFASPEQEGVWQSIVPRAVAAPQVGLFSGVVRMDLPSGNATHVAIEIAPVGGAPLTITAITPTVTEAGA